MKSVDRHIQDKIGVSATQVAALIYLNQNDGCLLVDLSRELMQNKSAITTLVERMEKNGFIEKVPSPIDKRASQLFLTPNGQEICKLSLPFIALYDQNIIEGFKEEELKIVTRFLNSIIDKFEILPGNFFKSQLEIYAD